MKNYNFLEVSLIVLNHFRFLLLFMITFWSILVLFNGSKNFEIQDGGSKKLRHYNNIREANFLPVHNNVN